jgi:stage V sporulation protein G
MEISDVRVRLLEDPSARLKAFCSITLDEVFVVRDLKVVEGTNGLFVAMPSRRLLASCRKCGQKNHLRARYCNECGAKLSTPPLPKDADGNPKLHRDVAHPIDASFREVIQEKVLEAYRAETNLTPEETEEAERPVSYRRRDEPMSEYDSLIAGLDAGQRDEVEAERGPRGRQRGRSRHKGPERAKGGAGERARSSRGRSDDRPRRGGRRRREEGTDRSEHPRKPAAKVTVTEEPVKEQPKKPAAQPAKRSAFGAGVVNDVPDDDTLSPTDEIEYQQSDEGDIEAAEVPGGDAEASDVIAHADKPASDVTPEADRASVDQDKESTEKTEESSEDKSAFGAGIF